MSGQKRGGVGILPDLNNDMNKKYQIFISSTYEDLKEERTKVRDTILSMNQIPAGMEFFGAADDEQWEIIKRTIDTSDFYVLIIGYRYGSIIETGEYTGMSYTEKEYRYAKEHGIPILAYILKTVTKKKITEDRAKQDKLSAFKRVVKSGRQVDFWKNKDDLCIKISTSLSKEMSRIDRPGWIRGDVIDIEKSLKTIVDLNSRVDSLEKENKYLKSRIETRSPKLNLAVSVNRHTENGFGKESSNVNSAEGLSIKLVRKRVEIDNSFTIPPKLSMSDVPEEVKEDVSFEDIEKYNNALPTIDDIERYYLEMRRYTELKENGYLLDFIVSNDGTAKATNVSIDLEFPEQFIVMKKRSADGYPRPERPAIPENPITEAENRKKAVSLKDILGKEYFNALPQFSSLDYLPRPNIDYSDQYYVNVQDGEVNIRLSDLMHTREWTAEDVYIVPKESGVFKVPGYLMCEQYSKEEEVTLNIEVVDE